jgi:23S rRNA (adenine2030-N6)-methyltransferase
MLSYQHAYHAGNPADVHKHALLALVMDYVTRKPKPITYMETHAGRGLYDLSSREAKKTGEASAGVAKLLAHFPKGHPYAKVVQATRTQHGPDSYPGSPLIAEHWLRNDGEVVDRAQLAELHPQEHMALSDVMPRSAVHIYKEDGFPWAARLCPPTPRRGVMMIDPSYELEHDFTGLGSFLPGLHGLWPVGVIMLWYPILESGAHDMMLGELMSAGFETTLHHEVHFSAAQAGHRLQGSGMFIINPPYTLADEAADVSAIFEQALA